MPPVSVELFAYPWDIVDEGCERFLDRCLELSINRVHATVSYHSGKFLLPRNTRARVYFPEPGALYFAPPATTWTGGLRQPASSLVATKWLETLATHADGRRVSLSSWAVFFHNSTLGASHPELTVQNVFGDRYPFALCPSQPRVREHGGALCRSLASLGFFSGIDLETIGYLGYFHGHHHEVTAIPLGTAETFLLSLCFCSACRAQGEKVNIDMESLAVEVRRILAARMQCDDLMGGPSDNSEQLTSLLVLCSPLQRLVRMRMDTITSLVEYLSAESGGARLAALTSSFVGSPSNIWMEGISPPDLKRTVDCFHLLAYAREAADANADLIFFLNMIEDPGQLNLTINLGLPATRTFDDAAAKVEFARRQGVRRFSFFNYGLLGETRLRWIRDLARIAREPGP